MTPAMLAQASRLAADKALANVSFERGDAGALPYPDAAFAVVTTRFSFHHFLDPLAVLREMRRVCAPGGRVVVVDMYASEDAGQAAEWNRLEKLRDPSHVRCLSLTELRGLFGAAGLPEPEATFYELGDTVAQPAGAFVPEAGGCGEDHRDVRGFGRGWAVGHSGAAQGRSAALRVSGGDPCSDQALVRACFRAKWIRSGSAFSIIVFDTSGRVLPR